jgi:hypothetical protein
MSVKLNEAILSGDWCKCNCATVEHGTIEFKLKPKHFSKIDVTKIDGYETMKIDDGEFWLLKLDLVNVSKSQYDAYYIFRIVVLTDQDGYNYHAFDHGKFTYSEYADLNATNRFRSMSPVLVPKIKTSGALPFFLPYDEEAEYSINIVSGDLTSL